MGESRAVLDKFDQHGCSKMQQLLKCREHDKQACVVVCLVVCMRVCLAAAH